MNLIVLNPSYDPYSTERSKGVETYSNRSQNSWLSHLFKRKRSAAEVDKYRKMLKDTLEASRSMFINILDDGIGALQTFASWIVRTVQVSVLNVVALVKGVVDDFWWNSKEEETPVRHGDAVQDHEEVAKDQLDLFAWRRLTLAQQVSQTFAEKLNIPHGELHLKDEAAYLANLRAIVDQMAATAPIAQVPYHLRPYRPADALSQLMGGVEGFYGFFSAYYETCPSIALYASAVYLLSAAAIINPALIGQISQSLDFINTWSRVTAEAMSSSQYSQIVAAGFSGFKETLLALQFASDGTDSTLAHAIGYLHTHLPQIVIGGAVLIGTGYELSVLGNKVPIIGAEGGNVPGLEQSFVAAKVGVVAYESLHSEYGQQSLAARTLTAALFVPFLALRIALIPVNLIHKGLAELALIIFRVKDSTRIPPSVQQICKPLAEDLPKGIVSLSLRLVDVLLRLLNVMFMAFKVIPKTITDWLVNNLATSANHFQLVIGAVLGLAVAVFLLPHLLGVASIGLFPAIAIGLAGALVTQVICASFGLNIKLPMVSQFLLGAKHALFSFCDWALTRPLKGVYESLRNDIARVLTSAWMTGKEDIATYGSFKPFTPNPFYKATRLSGVTQPPVEAHPTSGASAMPPPQRPSVVTREGAAASLRMFNPLHRDGLSKDNPVPGTALAEAHLESDDAAATKVVANPLAARG